MRRNGNREKLLSFRKCLDGVDMQQKSALRFTYTHAYDTRYAVSVNLTHAPPPPSRYHWSTLTVVL